MISSIIEYALRLIESKSPKLMAYYQEFRLRVTGDVQSYKVAWHFLAKKKHSDKRYCIFKIPYTEYSLFAAANAYIFLYTWATHHRLIPIIDFEYPYSFHQGRLGEDNKWEYCFQQPISIKEAKRQKYVLIRGYDIGVGNSYLRSTCIDINGKKDDIYVHVTDKNWRKYYSNVNKYVKKCWIFKQELLDSYEREIGTKLQKANNVLGVFLRETFSEEFYKHLNNFERNIYDRHPRVPNIDTTINIVKEYMCRWNCDYIVLSTIYQDSVERFQDVFKDKIIVVDREREKSIMDAVISRGKGWEATEEEIYQREKKFDQKERLISYAKEIIALSRCDYLIAAKGGGAAAALSLNGGNYKDICILSDQNKIARY